MKTYNELVSISTFEDRIRYLMCNSSIGIDTFGFDRYLNQKFYSSPEWRRIRNTVIIRDNGCDLAMEGYEIPNGIIIHHLNPITRDQVIERSPEVFDMNNLVCVSDRTHRIIHYGSENNIREISIVERHENDTIPWR